MTAFRNRISPLSLLTALALALPAKAQVITAGPDSAVVSTPTLTKDSRRTEKLLGMAVTRPKKAGLLAAVLPGAGQIYNRKYWKLPLVYGAIGGTLYGEYFYQTRYREYVDGYAILTTPRKNRPANYREQLGPNVAKARDSSVVYQGIIFYRNKRDVFIAYAALAYTMTILDAVVDAHLKDFDISDDLGLRWQPSLLWMPTAALTPGISITLSLNNTRAQRPLK
ncbi:DUF5683 domain-containing protein [Hymenobacter lucidus]|uniref:DUF5683 domain-containing protein n=1 Tax=Hymenobacter lucidus TaxID=2880930 RepID=A0ABS8AN38_9BACT|nr:DUF5683 domain-containing protein [Hymenobacter lucidus]MCB2407603.1 DUF5683 domain-containing protein [Hymenobacter lucidus]